MEKGSRVHSGHGFFFSDEWFFWEIFADVQETKNETHVEIMAPHPGANFPCFAIGDPFFDLLVKVLGMCSKGVLKPTLEERIFVDLFLDLHGFLTNSREKG